MDQVIIHAMALPLTTHLREDIMIDDEPKPCFLLQAPRELKLEIISYLNLRRELYNLSRTCKDLEDVVLERLYWSTDITIPGENSPGWQRGSCFAPRPHVVRTFRRLTLRSGLQDLLGSQLNCKWCFNADSAEPYAIQMIRQMPVNQLKSFSFMHRTAFTQEMFDNLTFLQRESLSELRFYEIHKFVRKLSNAPIGLEKLECRSIQDGEALGHLAGTNKSSLRSLYLGKERELFEQYRRTRTGLFEQSSLPLSNFKSALGGDLSSLPQLRRLALVGLDLSPIIPTTVESALFFTTLNSLIIESCSHSAEFLSRLAGTFDYAQYSHEAPTSPSRMVPQLRCFRFRDESPRAPLKEALVSFLESFSGLKTLSLLLENATLLERPARLIASHGPSLETLVLETRIQPREQLALDTSRPFGMGNYSSQLWEEAINDICRLCPDLVELGMGFPWNDEMVRLRKSMLPMLQRLKTIHIRNFPESQMRLQVGDYSIKEYATKFMDWTYGSTNNLSSSPDTNREPLQTSEAPKLETLSIGPTIYESRFKGCYTGRATRQGGSNGVNGIPEFLRTHHFALDWAQTRFGRWSPLVTSVSERYIEEIRGQKPLSGVFDGVWLR